MLSKRYYVYIVTNSGGNVLYTGVTNDLVRRMHEHRSRVTNGFASRYRLGKLVYYECVEDIRSAIEREKQIKAGSRRGKLALINRANSHWKDLWPEISGTR